MRSHQTTQTKALSSGLGSYVCGFVFAIVLTIFAYVIVTERLLDEPYAIGFIMGLAAVQLLVQLVFFLHFGRDKQNRWNSAALYFMLIIMVVIVGGSLWIMANLNYNMMMTPEEMNHHMLEQSNKGF
jgi:cytochrome o ubiquinol oxidase operon protein cyoD